MKKITAYVKPFKLESILEKLQNLPAPGAVEILLSEVCGYGRQKGKLEEYRGKGYELTFLPKARVEIYCEDSGKDAVVQALLEGARTGRIGDGKIVISSVEQSVLF